MNERHALVTNARDFLGPPAVAALSDAGFRVMVHDRAFGDMGIRQEYEAAHPGVTVLDEQGPEELVAAAWDRAGRVDALVSNDSFPAIHVPVAQGDPQGLRDTFEALVIFPYSLMRAAIPRLTTQAEARVVMVTSCRTRLPMPYGAIPDAARDAVNALVKSLSLELAPHGIPVNAIAPNFVYSEAYFPRAQFIDDPGGREFIRRTVPVGRMAEPEEAGELIHYLATMKGSFMTGSVIDFAGGWPAAPKRPE